MTVASPASSLAVRRRSDRGPASSSRRIRQSAGERDRLPGERCGGDRVERERGPRLPDERAEPDAVDLRGLHPEPVADRVADDRLLPAGAAGTRDEHLEALRRVRGGLIAPDELDQLLGADRPSVTGRERRQQRTRALPDDGRPSPADIVQKLEHDRHASQSKERLQTDR